MFGPGRRNNETGTLKNQTGVHDNDTGAGQFNHQFDDKGDRPVFCERCAALTRRLTWDPLAEPHAELLTGSCIWMDERCRDWCSDCTDKVKEFFHLRYQITVGDSLPPEAVGYFLELEKQFPNWPLFRPERRSPGIADKVRRMVRHNLKRACIELEKMDREYRKREAEQTEEHRTNG